MANITFNPAVTTSPQSSFQAQTQGAVQGTFYDDPSSRMWLSQGIVYASVSMPIFGGLPIEELVATAPGVVNALGNIINLASAESGVTGFSVFNQAHAMLIAPGNNVPLASAGMSVNFFRLGSNARLWVAIDSGLAAAVEGNPINTVVSWDFSTNALEATTGTALPVKILEINTNSLICSISNGLVNWVSGSAALIQI